MDTSVVNLIIFGVFYIIFVYIVFTVIRRKRYNSGNDSNDDGGIEIYTPPTLDLPPGITLPTGGPRGKIIREEPEDAMAG